MRDLTAFVGKAGILIAVLAVAAQPAVAQSAGCFDWTTAASQQGWSNNSPIPDGTVLAAQNGVGITFDWTETGTLALHQSFPSHVYYDTTVWGGLFDTVGIAFNQDDNDDTGEFITVDLTLSTHVIGLTFSLLDVDHSSWKDGVEVWYDNAATPGQVNVRDCAACSVALGANHFTDNEDYMHGWEATGGGNIASSSSAGNMTFDMGLVPVNWIRVRYRNVDDSDEDPSDQRIGISDLCWDDVTPAVVSGVRSVGGGEIEFTTSSEVDTAAFNVYRLSGRGNNYELVNDAQILATPGAAQGSVYRLRDPRAGIGQRYVVVEKTASGGERVHGPFTLQHGERSKVTGSRQGARPQMSDDFLRITAASPTPQIQPGGASLSLSQGILPGERDDELPKAQIQWAKGETSGQGMVWVSAAELAATWGVPEARVRTLISRGLVAIESRGQAVAWRGATDGSGLYFAAEGVDLATTDRNVYWFGSGEGRRMSSVADNPGAVPGGSYTEMMKLENQTFPVMWLAHDPNGDYWYSQVMAAGNPTYETASVAFGADAIASGDAQLKVRLQGATDTGAGEHLIEARLNGVSVGQTNWSGQSYHEATFSVGASTLAASNTLELTAVDTGVTSVVYLDAVEVAYPRFYQAQGGGLRFIAPSNGVVTVAGLSGSDVELFATAGGETTHLSTAAEADGSGGWQVSLSAVEGVSYEVASATSSLRLENLRLDAPSQIKSGSPADYLVITVPETRQAGEDLAQLRSSRYSTRVLDLEDVYDEFTHGLADVEALTSLVKHAYDIWGSKYLVLIGAGSMDPKGYGSPWDHLIPTRMVATPHGLAASDISLGDVNGDLLPEMIVGRIPATDGAEALAYVAKLSSYESQGPSNDVLFLSDNADHAGNFAADTESLIGGLTPGRTATHVSLEDAALADAQAALQASWANGPAWVNYVGHGGLDRLTAEGLLTNAEASGLGNQNLPILATLTCVSGNYAWHNYTSLAENLVLTDAGGAIAAWTPSGLSVNSKAVEMNGRLLSSVMDEATEDLGAAVKATLAGSSPTYGYMLQIYNILGDPAVGVR